MAVGAGLSALMGLFTKLDMSEQFQRQVREMLQPGSSAPLPRRREDDDR